MDAKSFLNSTILNNFNLLTKNEQKEVISQLESKYLQNKKGDKVSDISEIMYPHTGDTEPELTGAADAWNSK